MRFEQLEYLVAIAKKGSFNAAAQELYVTQQAISLGMKQLEQELGKPLFVKKNNKTILTSYGEKVLEYAQKTLQDKHDLQTYFQEHAEPSTELEINIGSTSCVANITLPAIIAEWERKKKQAFFNIVSMENMLAVLEQVKHGEKDIGLISMNAEELKRKFIAYEDELEIELLAQDEVVAVINRKNYTGEKEYMRSNEYYNHLKTRYNLEPMENWHERIGVPFSAGSNDVDFHRAMLELTNACVTMSGLSYQYFFNNKKYVALQIENNKETLHHVAVYRKDAEPHIQELVRMIRKEMHVK